MNKQQIINEIVWLFKEWSESTSETDSDKIYLRLIKYNNIFKTNFNCLFMNSSEFYYDFDTESYIPTK